MAAGSDLLGQLCMSLAFKYGEASVVAPFSYLMIIFTYLSDGILFHYNFTPIETGASIVVLFALLIPVIVKWLKS